jgi:holo-[acyl-carrier protein] synthase
MVGVGVAVVDIARVEQLLDRHPARAVTKLFTTRETEYARNRARPARHYAARLAAKEAAFKALAGNDLARGIAWRDIEVLPATGGPPGLVLHGRAAERAAQLGASKLWLSMSHTDGSAVALVVLESDGAHAAETVEVQKVESRRTAL